MTTLTDDEIMEIMILIDRRRDDLKDMLSNDILKDKDDKLAVIYNKLLKISCSR